mgnify:CR=1 FL=1
MVLVPLFINAQSVSDAINWSFENESGNSRYESMAGPVSYTHLTLPTILLV